MNNRRLATGFSVTNVSSDSQSQKSPMTLDDLAVLAGRCYREGENKHPLRFQAADILCASIRGMVFKQAYKYSLNCKVDVEDLVQDCFSRITSRIVDFDPNIAKFTTWAWRVCTSVLNGGYRRHQPWNEHIVLGIEGDLSDEHGANIPVTNPDMGVLLRMDIITAIKDLSEKHPKHSNLIRGFFGNPDENSCGLPSSMMIAEAAKQEGMSYVAANLVFKRIVRPFFLKRFADKSKVPIRILPMGVKGTKNKTDEKKGKRMGVVESAVVVLKDSDVPLTSKQIFDSVISRRLYVPVAVKPYVAYCNVLRRYALKEDSQIKKTGISTWRAVA